MCKIMLDMSSIFFHHEPSLFCIPHLVLKASLWDIGCSFAYINMTNFRCNINIVTPRVVNSPGLLVPSYCEFCLSRILPHFPMLVCQCVSVSQAWHLKFSQSSDYLGHVNHIDWQTWSPGPPWPPGPQWQFGPPGPPGIPCYILTVCCMLFYFFGLSEYCNFFRIPPSCEPQYSPLHHSRAQ